MSSDEIRNLETQLEVEKGQLREDLSAISRKTQEIREDLSPTNFLRDYLFPVAAIAMALGFFLGYREVPIAELAKPAAKTGLTTAASQAATTLGKEAALSAIR